MRPVRPHQVGTLFDELAARGAPTTVHLTRPLDIAPGAGTTLDIPTVAAVVTEAAGWLSAAGVRPGDRVAVIKDNHWDYDLLAFAAVRIGAVPALISARLPAETMQILLKRLDPALLVTTSPILRAARDGETDLTALARRTLRLDFPGSSREEPDANTPEPGTLCLDDVTGYRAPVAFRRGDHDPLVVNHTSGTTGVPKLVVHSVDTIINRLAGFEARRWPVLAARRTDTVASASAFTHGRTFCWTASVFCLTPRKVLIVADHDPATAGPLLAAHPPSIMEGLPATFVRWLPLAGRPASSNPFRDVRLYISTYDAVHPPAVRAFLNASRRRGAMWMHGWGQTETGPLTFRFFTRRALSTWAGRHPTTRNAGRPVPGRTRLRVVDPATFAPVPAGKRGLIQASTRARCLGYVGEADRFAAKCTGEWFNTGDIGVRTRTGAVLLLDREVDMLPEASCIELEDVIDDRLADVSECVILSRPGRLPLPVLVTAGGALDRDAWSAAVADLPPLAEPIVTTDDRIPRTGTGKVRRGELRTRFPEAADTYGTGRWT